MLFLKAQTEIFINLDPKNYNEAYIRERPYLHLINTLTTGREDSPKPAFSTGKFYGLDKTTFKKNQVEHPQSYFFLGKDIDLEKATKQQKKNGYFFAFPEDLLKSWEKISLVNKNETPHSLPVRKDHAGKRFGSWKDLEQYWHPTTSLIIYDPYLLNEKASLCTNLIPMLDALISPLEACVEVLVIGDLEDHVVIDHGGLVVVPHDHQVHRVFRAQVDLRPLEVGAEFNPAPVHGFLVPISQQGEVADDGLLVAGVHRQLALSSGRLRTRLPGHGHVRAHGGSPVHPRGRTGQRG